MPSNGPHSGRFAVVNGVSTVRNWQISDTANVPTAVASNTAFGTARKPGIEDWSGSYESYGSSPPAGQMPGDTIAFVGYQEADNDQGGPGQEYSGNALIKSVAITWNFAGGEIIHMTTEFEGNLALAVAPSTGPALDGTLPNLPIVGGTKLSWATDAAPTVFTDFTNTATATLTITSNNPSFVDSSTFVAGAPGRFWTGRKKGIFDWTLSITEDNVDRSRFQKGDSIALKLWTDATHFWLLQFGRVKEYTNIVMDRETGKIIQQTINIEMNAVGDTNGALGTITKPDTTVWWPVAQT